MPRQSLVLVWVYEKTDTLLAPILAHSVFNLLNFFLLIYERESWDWLERVRKNASLLEPSLPGLMNEIPQPGKRAATAGM